MTLPIDEVLGEVAAAVRDHGLVVLQAPPGAGKTTRVPVHLLEVVNGRILMLEPRRIAARSAARYIAARMGADVGGLVGYRMRGESRVSGATRIEVVTEGILTAMIQSEPDLPGVGCVIFDEFHERSIHADLGLALALEVREALRPDLALVVMSATLDAAPVAALMGDAPVVTSEGRSFPVEMRWLDRPWRDPRGRARFEAAMAAMIREALAAEDGSVLAFLPGAGEITRCAGLLRDLPEGCRVLPLYGALPFAEQTEALRPAPPGQRHVVLATAIAETSVTIPDIRIVVDGGLARRPRFDPGSGLGRLVTERVAKAEATQRAGRAGRVAPGVCYRMWTKGEDGGLAPFAPVAMLDDDLMGLALNLAIWGARDARGLRFLTPPPEGTLAEAQGLLRSLGVLDETGTVTGLGRKVAAAPLHPRLAVMLERGAQMDQGPAAALLATVLDTPRGSVPDLHDALRQAGAEARKAASRLARGRVDPAAPVGALLAHAYPDRIAQRRAPGDARFLMANGRGAALARCEDFGNAAYLVIADLDGAGRDARIRAAAPISMAEIEAQFGDRVEETQVCRWDKRRAQAVAELQTRLGALVLATRPAQPAPEEMASAMTEGVRQLGLNALPWTKATRQLCTRVATARRFGADLADLSDDALMSELEDWLMPHLGGMARREHLAGLDLAALLQARLGWDGQAKLDTALPAKFALPTGNTVAIDYSGDQPKVSARLQEFLGTTTHPAIGPNRVPLLVELLSPAHRPIQTTGDLPGFWATSYQDVRKDMRGRYPKHHWPEDPAAATPTARAKPRRR